MESPTIEVAEDGAPVPEPDADSALFWQALGERKLVFQRCGPCGRIRYPAMAHCPYCAAREHTWQQSSGRGVVYSWIVVRQAFWPEFAGEIPYALATVDLDEGVRVVGRMDDVDAPTFGLPVQASYVAHPRWMELRFVGSRS